MNDPRELVGRFARQRIATGRPAAMAELSDWRQHANLLCVRPDNIGDVLMTTPALRALKQGGADDSRRITLLTSRAGTAIAKYIPEIDAAIAFDPPWYKHERASSVREVRAIVKELAMRHFDAAILFTVFSQNPLPSAMLCWLAGIPRIAAYCRENPYALVTDWVADREPLYEIKHEVRRQLDLVAWLGARTADESLSLRAPDGKYADLLAKLVCLGVRTDITWVVMHPGASEVRRRYPAELFAAAARKLAGELGCQVLVTGVTAERALTERVASGAGQDGFALAGELDLAEFIALLKISPLLVSNNTGPVHIAAAVQTPVVVLYALTNPQHAPWQVPHRVLPFAIRERQRSGNVLVRYAAEKSFAVSPGMIDPDDIVMAAQELLAHPTSPILPATPVVRVAAPSP